MKSSHLVAGPTAAPSEPPDDLHAEAAAAAGDAAYLEAMAACRAGLVDPAEIWGDGLDELAEALLDTIELLRECQQDDEAGTAIRGFFTDSFKAYARSKAEAACADGRLAVGRSGRRLRAGVRRSARGGLSVADTPSLRDFFAAHAPAEPPTWFTVPALPFEAPRVPEHPRDSLVDIADPDARERCRRWLADGWDDYGLETVFSGPLPPDVCAWRIKCEAWNHAQQALDDARAEYRLAYERARFVAWRWEYADLMLAARGSAGQVHDAAPALLAALQARTAVVQATGASA